MAVDSKSQHIGNHEGKYTDIDGMTKQFTVIDHDKKTTISKNIQEKEDFTSFFSEYRKQLIDRILNVPASLCPEPFFDYTIRGEGVKTITWNNHMLKDEGSSIKTLRDLCIILENRAETIRLIP